MPVRRMICAYIMYSTYPPYVTELIYYLIIRFLNSSTFLDFFRELIPQYQDSVVRAFMYLLSIVTRVKLYFRNTTQIFIQIILMDMHILLALYITYTDELCLYQNIW